MNIYIFLILIVLVYLVIFFQIKGIKKIIIREKINKHILLIEYIIGILFLIWGFFLIESMYQYILFIGISLIFFLSSYTTGLGGKSYYYKSKNLGLGGYAIKHHSYSEITDYRIYEKYDDIVLVFIHKNFETKMKFSIKDKEKIHTIIDGRNNE